MLGTLAELTDSFLSGFQGCELLKVVDSFRREKPLCDMMLYLWRLPEAHRYLTPGEEGCDRMGKDVREAEKARVHGNELYLSRKLDLARHEYNRSIAMAPHPPSRLYPNVKQNVALLDRFVLFSSAEETEPAKQMLSRAYANRSLVLLEQERADLCLRDIGMAFIFGYPKKLRYKLVLRWAKIYIGCGFPREAANILSGAIKSLHDLPEPFREKAAQELLCLYLGCRHYSSGILSVPELPVWPEKKAVEVPEMARDEPSVGVLTDAVRMAYSATKGRHLVAANNIAKGEVLLSEKSFAAVPSLDVEFVCANCLGYCIAPLPCPECCQMSFCSLICQEEALLGFHGTECPIWSSLINLRLPSHVLLAFRVLTTKSLEAFLEEEPLLRQEAETGGTAKLGCNQERRFASSDYRTVYHLPTNQTDRPHLDAFNACIAAFVLLKLLLRSERFFQRRSRTVVPTEEELVLLGSALCSHILSLGCNGNTINEIALSPVPSSKSQTAGLGIFPALSLANHSCSPSAKVTICSTLGKIVALRPIPKGEEVTCSYGVTHQTITRKRRRALLQEAYHFHCECEACRKDWPLARSLPRIGVPVTNRRNKGNSRKK